MTRAVDHLTWSWRIDLGEEPRILRGIRITLIVVGILGTLTGILILYQLPLFNNLGTTAGWVFFSVGGVLALPCGLLKCVKETTKSPKQRAETAQNKSSSGVVKRRDPLQKIEIEERPELFNKASTKERSYEYVWYNAAVKALLIHPDLPQEITLIVRAYINENQAELLKENVTMPYAIQPTVASMKEGSSHDQEKYGITIEICSAHELNNNLTSWRQSYTQEPFGIIVIQADCDEGHVTPLLCDFIGNKKDVLSLDSIGSLDINPGPTIKLVCNSQNLNLIGYPHARQADRVSCRTDARVILRNALLHIKKLRSEGCYSSLSEVIHSTTEPTQIPLEWNYTDQITPTILKEKGDQGTYVIRDLFSSKEEKKKNPQKATAFRERYMCEIEFKYTLQLEKDRIKNPLPNFSTLKLPSHVAVQKSDSFLKIIWSERRNINIYLMDKGARNAQLVQSRKDKEKV